MTKVKDKPWNDALKAIAEVPKTVAKKLEEADARVRIYPKKSKVLPKTPNNLTSITSPLTEKADSRTYHPDHVLYSTDGFFSIVYKPIKEVTFEDFTGQEIVFIFLEPDADGQEGV